MKVSIPFLLTLLLMACGEPERIEDLSKNIRNVETVEGNIVVNMTTVGFDGGEHDMTSISHTFLSIAKWQMTTGGGVEKSIGLRVSVPTLDAYGNKGMEKAFFISVTSEHLRRINWDNFLSWDLMNLAQFDSYNRFGRQLATTWCADDSNRKYSARFCNRVTS